MKDIKSLRQKNTDELRKELGSSREKLVNLRFERATGAVKKTHQFDNLRKKIAKILTLLKEDQSQPASLVDGTDQLKTEKNKP
jgi:large subunit ribosomal protein L29